MRRLRPPEDAKQSRREVDVRDFFRQHGRNVWNRVHKDTLAEIVRDQGVPADLRGIYLEKRVFTS